MYGDIELRDEIRKFYKDEYDLDIAPDEVIVTTSGLIAMYMALQAILDEGDEVIIQSPFFTPYTAQVEMAQITDHSEDKGPDHKYTVQPDRFMPVS